MSYKAMYRKWRPMTFTDVYGQAPITDTLKAQVELGRLSHAYLFAGTRGTGKTTCAKILSRAVNCEQPIGGNPCNKCPTCLGILDGSIVDVVEIDAASNNGVDNVRELRDEAIYLPANTKYRVYIIDEVHMFSNNAFNALLKILEEPPAHVIFILATTELHKMPATVLSRCQRYTFKRIDTDTIYQRLEYIRRSENISASEDALRYIARIADGGMRDALSIFEQVVSFAETDITMDKVNQAVGLSSTYELTKLVTAISEKDTEGALKILFDLYIEGRDLVSVLGEISSLFRDMLLIKTAPNLNYNLLSLTVDSKVLKELAGKFETHELLSKSEIISKTVSNLYASTNKKIEVELCFIRLCVNQDELPIQKPKEVQKPNVAAPTPPPVAPIEKKEEPPKEELSKEELSKEEPQKEESQKEEPPKESISTVSDNFWSAFLSCSKKELLPNIYSIIKDTTGEFKDNTLFIYSNQKFGLSMISSSKNAELIHKCAENAFGHKVMVKFEFVETMPTSQKEIDPLDHLLNNPNITIK